MPNYPTQRQKNGFKLQLLRDKCEEYQRNIFHKHFPRDSKQLYVELKKHDKEFQNLLNSKGKLLKQVQYDILLPAPGETHSEKFDCTLLALLLRRLCGLTGWNDEPAAHDTSEIANLIRLKIGRNGIQHNPLGIETREYKRWYSYLKQPLLDLGCPQSEISNLLASFQYGLLPVDPLFIGRDKELDDIKNEILQNQLGVVLVGIGGVGKSETTRKYWQLYQHQFDENVIWINANTKISLEDTFKTVAELLNLETIDTATKKPKSIKAIVTMVHQYFKDEKALFIFDNCSTDTKSHIAEFISVDHSTIITSQIRNWGQTFHEIDIDSFTPTDGKLFLKNNLDQIELKDIESQNGLLSILDYHPLAIQHAVAYMKETNMTTATYLKLLKEHKIQLLSTKVTLNQGASASVLGCLDMTLQQIKNKSDNAFRLINIMSFLDGKYIYGELLKIVLKNEFDFVEALRLLQSRSIIKCHTSAIPGKQPVEVVSIHGLSQTAMRADQKRNGVIKESLSMVLDLFFDKYTAQSELDPMHVDFGTEWYLHLLHILNQESLAQYTLERVAKNQRLVFGTLYSKSMWTTINEIWNKLVLLLQCDKTDPLFYEARLFAVCCDMHLTCKAERLYAEIYEIFNQIKENVREDYSESFVGVITASINTYNAFPEHKRQPLADLGMHAQYNSTIDYLGFVKEETPLEALINLEFQEKYICNLFGANHPLLGPIYYSCGKCYEKLNDFHKAIYFYRKAAKIIKYYEIYLTLTIATLLHENAECRESLVELKRVERLLTNIDDQERRDVLALDCDVLKTKCFIKLDQLDQFSEFLTCADSVLSRLVVSKKQLNPYIVAGICYYWMGSSYRLQALLLHVMRIICSSIVRNDEDSKCTFQIMLNDCLIVNGYPTGDINKVQFNEQELFNSITPHRCKFTKNLIRRGHYYYALKILNNLKHFQNKGIEIELSPDQMLIAIVFCIASILRLLFPENLLH